MLDLVAWRNEIRTQPWKGSAAMVKQLDQLAQAFTDRHNGQSATLAAATATHRRYKEAAELALAELVADGRPFTVDDVRQRIPDDIQPHHPNVLPSLLGIWAERRLIVPCGEYRSQRRPRRASRNRVWMGRPAA
jgi:hypothetical protein